MAPVAARPHAPAAACARRPVEPAPLAALCSCLVSEGGGSSGGGGDKGGGKGGKAEADAALAKIQSKQMVPPYERLREHAKRKRASSPHDESAVEATSSDDEEIVSYDELPGVKR